MVAWNELVLTNAAPLILRDLPDIEFTFDPFWQPLTRRRRRRLRGGKTQPREAKRLFVPCYMDGPAKIVRANPILAGKSDGLRQA